MPSVTPIRHYFFFIFITACTLLSCKKSKTPPPPPPSSDKAITAFNFRQTDNASYIIEDVNGGFGGDSIFVTFPAETNLSNLKPTITFIGKSVSPASGVAANFSTPVNYTVTAENNSTKTYTVVSKYRKTIYISAEDGYAYALDGNNGQQIWKSVVSSFHSSSPVVAYGYVYLSGTDGIYALDAKNGTQKWKYPLPTPTGYEFLPSAMVANNTVYISCWDGFVYSLNAADGSLKWKTPSSGAKGFFSNVTLSGNMLYTGCTDSSLYALDATSGAISWKFNTGGPIYKNPVVANNLVFTGGLANHFYALNAATGAQVWHYPYFFMMASPAYYNNRIYCGGGSEAWGLDYNTGVQSWHTILSGPPSSYNERSAPFIENGVLYAGSIDMKLYAWDIATASKLWSTPTLGFIYSSPVLSDGVIYISSSDGNFYAFDAATGVQVWKKSVQSGRGSAAVADSKGIMHYSSFVGHVN